MNTLERVKEMGVQYAKSGMLEAGFPIEIFSEKYREVFDYFYEGYVMGLKGEVGIILRLPST